MTAPDLARWPTKDELVDALAARGWDEEPPGTRLGWCYDPDWRVRSSAPGAACRGGRRCPGRPVALLRRMIRLRGQVTASTPRWWAYCADHLYGGRIENGRVVNLRLLDTAGSELAGRP